MIVQGIQFKDHSKGRWALVSDLIIMGYIIPAGFVTDFRTTPEWIEWFVRLIVPKFHLCYVLHDYLYRYQVEPRKKADQVQWEYQNGFNLFQKCFVWFFVRLFGTYYYVKYLAVNNKISVKCWSWMFWAQAMVLDRATLIVANKVHKKLFEYQWSQIFKGQAHWYMKPSHNAHWLFLHEVSHLMQSRNKSRIEWIWTYIWNFRSFERQADQFANVHLNKSPKEIKELLCD